MHESCSVLEGQLSDCQRKASFHMDTQTKLANCQNQIKTLQADLAKVYHFSAYKYRQKNEVLNKFL